MRRPATCGALSYQDYAPPNPESIPSTSELQCAIDAVDAREPALLVVSGGCEGFCGGSLYLIRSDGTALQQSWTMDDGMVGVPGFGGSTVGEWASRREICDLVEPGTCTPATCDHPSDWFVQLPRSGHQQLRALGPAQDLFDQTPSYSVEIFGVGSLDSVVRLQTEGCPTTSAHGRREKPPLLRHGRTWWGWARLRIGFGEVAAFRQGHSDRLRWRERHHSCRRTRRGGFSLRPHVHAPRRGHYLRPAPRDSHSSRVESRRRQCFHQEDNPYGPVRLPHRARCRSQKTSFNQIVQSAQLIYYPGP